jgi:trigger factor
MQVSVEVTSGLQRRMTVSLPSERVDAEYQSRLKNLSRTVKLKGFRPGKVPPSVVVKHFGAQIKGEAIEQLIRSTLPEALDQENLQIAGLPSIDSVDEADESIRYVVNFEIYPDIAGLSVEGIVIERPSVEITDVDVDEMMESLRQQRRTWQATDRSTAIEGDRLTIDYSGSIDGESFGGSSAEDQKIVLGSKRFPEGFEEALVGAQKDVTTEFDVTFNSEHSISELAGKTAHFSVTIKNIEASLLPEFDDEFAVAFGVEEGGIEKMREDVRENLVNERDNAIKNIVKKRLFNGLMERNPIEAPAALVDEESQRMAANFSEELRAKGLNFSKQIEAIRFKEGAEFRVKMGLLLRELVSREQFKPDAEKVHDLLERLASTYEDSQAYIDWHYEDRSRLADVESAVLEDQVADWLLQSVSVSDKVMSFNDLMELAKREKTPIAPN